MVSESGTMYLLSPNEESYTAKNNLRADQDAFESTFVRQSYDVISNGLSFDCGMRMCAPPHPTSVLLQRMVSEFLAQHHTYMTEALGGLHLSADNIISVYTSIASEIVRQGNNSILTWGRVVLLFALGKRMAQLCFKEPSPTIRIFIQHVGKFVEKNAAAWIELQGGWESIYDVFGEDGDRRRPLLPGYVHALVIGLIRAFDYSNPIPFELLKF